VDDSQAVRDLLSSCSNDAEIVFSGFTKYNISWAPVPHSASFTQRQADRYPRRTPIDFGILNNVEIKILGNLELPRSISYVQSLVNASVGQRLYWFTVAGNNITVSGNQNPDWGFIDAYGEQWWTAAKYTYPLGGLVSGGRGLAVTTA
jgi:hypothetical protein